MHSALVDGSGKTLIKELAHEVNFVPENATADKALRLLLNEHCQLSVVVDEYGSVAGVLALEDIIESILGQEIFEHDDIAVDMRELAKRRNKSKQVDKFSKLFNEFFFIASKYWTHDLSPFLWEFPGDLATGVQAELDGMASPTY